MQILVINPGSTSTKVGLTRDSELVATKSIVYEIQELQSCVSVMEQKELRLQGIQEFLAEQNLAVRDLNAIVGRGGILAPVHSGTYRVNPEMLADLQEAKYGEHASNLGAVLAWTLAEPVGIPAYVVDPVVVDELSPEARYSGWIELSRQSILHALNIRRVVLRAAQILEKPIDTCNFVAVHLGGGITVAAVRSGKLVDVSNANHSGPFSPERAGSLPARELLKLCYSGQYDEKSLKKQINGKSGLSGYLGTNDAREIEGRMALGDREARNAFMAMAYQVAKEIGAMASILPELDGIIYTGGLAHSQTFLAGVNEHVATLTRIFYMPGENEMLALAEGAFRVLTGAEEVFFYSVAN